MAAGTDYGRGSAETLERVQVEMVSANPTGPITVASARNGAYGDSVARLLAFAGHQVEREYYYNDAGSQMDRFRASVDAVRRGEPIPEDGYSGAYIDKLAALHEDPVPYMLRQIEASLERFRIHFDSWALQSALASHLPGCWRTRHYDTTARLDRSTACRDENYRVRSSWPSAAGCRYEPPTSFTGAQAREVRRASLPVSDHDASGDGTGCRADAGYDRARRGDPVQLCTCRGAGRRQDVTPAATSSLDEFVE